METKHFGFIIILIFLSVSIAHSQALVLHHQSGSIDIIAEDFTDEMLTTVQTSRILDDKEQIELWVGISLEHLLEAYTIAAYDEIIFTADDGYQVRLSRQEVYSHTCLLALRKDNRDLASFRLVIPTLREMYWIAELSYIDVVENTMLMDPNILFSAENILKSLPLIIHPLSYSQQKAYLFRRLITNYLPYTYGEYVLKGNDGLERKLDYQSYLKNALVIPHEDGSFDLISPDMPAGMWIKNIAYFQNKAHGIAFFFPNAFSSYEHFSQITGLDFHDTKTEAVTDSGELLDKANDWLNLNELKKIRIIK